MYRVGIIGCGLIGNKRADALGRFPHSRLVKVADTNVGAAKSLSEKYKCAYTSDWRSVTRDKEINIVIVATPNNLHSEIAIDALKNGKHVLIEKPAGRNPGEVRKIIDAYEGLGKKYKVKVGFNHRFHPAFDKAKEIINGENIGEIMYIRARYGHGGRPGYDKEWRADKSISGGGEMLDQGSHIIDLSRYFMGDFKDVVGHCSTFFWNMKVEDNCFAIMKTGDGKVAQLHASCTQWKNMFSFEIFCKTGLIVIDGLGRSYGKETLTFYKMKPGMGPPDKKVFEWDEPDLSWEKEYGNFIEAIEKNHEPNGNIYDAYETIKIVYKLYESSGDGA